MLILVKRGLKHVSTNIHTPLANNQRTSKFSDTAVVLLKLYRPKDIIIVNYHVIAWFTYNMNCIPVDTTVVNCHDI